MIHPLNQGVIIMLLSAMLLIKVVVIFSIAHACIFFIRGMRFGPPAPISNLNAALNGFSFINLGLTLLKAIIIGLVLSFSAWDCSKMSFDRVYAYNLISFLKYNPDCWFYNRLTTYSVIYIQFSDLSRLVLSFSTFSLLADWLRFLLFSV